MPVSPWHEREAARSLERLLPRLERPFGRQPGAWPVFRRRLGARFPELFAALHALYGERYDFFWHLEHILRTAAGGWLGRSDELRALDARREAEPTWFLSNQQVGAVAYVDRFAGDLAGVRERLPYLAELGVTYLHLMPLFRRPPGDSDGGYAVSSYREVHRPLGTMAELADLAAALRARGISLVIDFICNHTADDHPWAQAARAGNVEYQDHYLMFDDREWPDRYQPHLRDIFPDRGGGAFTWRDDVAGPNGGKWVWTTFYRYQWDLNYRNPALFAAVAGEMLFLANQGVEVLRLDAVPFLWKTPGTNCENLPEAHTVVQALNALTDIAAPALVFKSEAIVHPDEVARYIAVGECHLSYNPLLMVLLWEALATRDTTLARYSLAKRFATEEGTAWVNYIRGHDDIGWGFADEDCAAVGINGFDHRRFLNAFYTGRFPGSFARGLPFQENPRTGDCRVCGTAASLAGLERAVVEDLAREIEYSVRRILLLHGVILTIGGVPLLYLGDEIAQLNDYGFADDPATQADARWLHRKRFDLERLAAARAHPDTPHGRVFHGLQRLIELRRGQPALAGSAMRVLDPASPHLLAYLREHDGHRLLVLANVSEHPLQVEGRELCAAADAAALDDLLGAATVTPAAPLAVAPYQFLCLVPDRFA